MITSRGNVGLIERCHYNHKEYVGVLKNRRIQLLLEGTDEDMNKSSTTKKRKNLWANFDAMFAGKIPVHELVLALRAKSKLWKSYFSPEILFVLQVKKRSITMYTIRLRLG